MYGTDVRDITRYELPPGGISLLGYIARRMHKTQWLMPVPVLAASGHTQEALAHVAMYAVSASTSFGRAYYQPRFDRVGEEISERDPETGALVRVTLRTNSPTYRVAYAVTLPHGSSFTGEEEITGTTVSLRGLGMPAPSTFRFRSDEYTADLTGILTSELTYAFFAGARIRAYGFLNFRDSAGNEGTLALDRNSRIQLRIEERDWQVTGRFQVHKREE